MRRIHNKKIEVIKIKSGSYNGEEFSDYLNKSIFSNGELARICCDYDSSTQKFKLMKDIAIHLIYLLSTVHAGCL